MTVSKNDLKFTRAEINLLLQNLDQLSDYEVQSLNDSLEELDRQEHVEECQNDLIAFAKHMQDDYMVGKHHRILADRLMEVERGEKDRVCVNLPPRHGKSALTSLLYPAWFIGKNPKKSIIMVSHTADLAVDFGRKVRNIIASPRYAEIFPDVSLASDSKSSGRWNTNHGGEFFACGVGSALAGRGADLLLVDDPHALEVNTPIPTPNGFVPIKDLKAGDFVYGPDGEPTEVVGKSQVWKDRELYSVTTSDGEEILCDAQHLWGVNSNTTVSEAKVYNFTAEYLFNWPKPNRPIIPRHLPVEYPERALPIDPWVLGMWLGDGTADSGRFTAHPDDQGYVKAELQSAGYAAGPNTSDGFTFTVYGLRPQLRELGVLNNKHIPEQYRIASVDQRMALLQGLMDADGTVTPASQAIFCNTNLGLVEGVKEILHSLGVKATVRSHIDTRGRWGTAKPLYRVAFRLADCARMPRKARYTRTPTDKRSRSISSEPTGRTGAVQCISVARADGLFLAGRGYVVTHNSEQDLLAGNFAALETAYAWFAYGARTRLMKNGRIALIHTRWHQADLTGKVVAAMTRDSEADQYEVTEFPAILEVDDGEGGIIEKALWPEFFPLKELKRTKASMPLFQWNAQYQQNPTSEEAAVIKREWWQRWTRDRFPSCEGVIMSLDAAAETHNRADYTALTTWGVFVNEDTGAYNLILLNAIKTRVDFPDLKQLCIKEYQDWQPDSFIVEKKSAGVAIYQELRRMGIPVTEYTPHRGSGDKMARLNSVADIIASGLVWVTDHPWAEELVEEVAAFPFASHDDLVDSMVYALMRFRQGGLIRLGTDYDEEYAPRPRQTAYY